MMTSVGLSAVNRPQSIAVSLTDPTLPRYSQVSLSEGVSDLTGRRYSRIVGGWSDASQPSPRYSNLSIRSNESGRPPRYSSVVGIEPDQIQLFHDTNDNPKVEYKYHLVKGPRKDKPWATLGILTRVKPTSKDRIPRMPRFDGSTAIEGDIQLSLKKPSSIHSITAVLRGRMLTGSLDADSSVFIDYPVSIYARDSDHKLVGMDLFGFSIPFPVLVNSTTLLPYPTQIPTISTHLMDKLNPHNIVPFNLSTPTHESPPPNERSSRPISSKGLAHRGLPSSNDLEQEQEQERPRFPPSPGPQLHPGLQLDASSNPGLDIGVIPPAPADALSSASVVTPFSPFLMRSQQLNEKRSLPSIEHPASRPPAYLYSGDALPPDVLAPFPPDLTPRQIATLPEKGRSPNPSSVSTAPPFSTLTQDEKRAKQEQARQKLEGVPSSGTRHPKYVQPIPPTFLERQILANVYYEFVIRITHGLLRKQEKIKTNFVFEPTVEPSPFSYKRQSAYGAGLPVPGPEDDPEGWHTLSSISMKGELLEERPVDLEYTLSLAKPLTYTRGSIIPCYLTIRSNDMQALNLLAISTTQNVKLTRRVRYRADGRVKGAAGSYSSSWNSNTPDGMVDTFTEIRLAVWRIVPPKPGLGRDLTLRTLEGEIHLPGNLKPSCPSPFLSISYAVQVLPLRSHTFRPTARPDPRLEPEEQTLISHEISIAANYCPGLHIPNPFSTEIAAENLREQRKRNDMRAGNAEEESKPSVFRSSQAFQKSYIGQYYPE